MSNEQKKEFGRFAFSGLIATAVDYTLLNFFAVLLGLPILIANSISAPFSSFVSYKLNKNVVFQDRMHGRRKTIVLYVAILGFGILVIQNSLLHVFYDTFTKNIAVAIEPAVDTAGLNKLSNETIAINLAKIGASLVAALWNYFMLRRFVFVTQEEAEN